MSKIVPMINSAPTIKTVVFFIAVFFTTLCTPPASAQNERLCFTFAQTYYEQLYCEIKAQNKGSRLPAFYEFQRNNAITQALLLKRPARDIGVKLAMPTARQQKKTPTVRKPKTTVKQANVATVKQPPSRAAAKHTATDTHYSLTGCNINSTSIHCSQQQYKLIGNRANQQLSKQVFSESNTMDMPVFRGSINDAQAVDQYLQGSYTHYLQKMLSIGLGGSTLSYGKFAYLFDDLNQKKVSFSERFEKMYFYLKKDKQRMAVNTRVASPDALSLDDCYPLKAMLVCSVANKNYIYLRASR